MASTLIDPWGVFFELLGDVVEKNVVLINTGTDLSIGWEGVVSAFGQNCIHAHKMTVCVCVCVCVWVGVWLWVCMEIWRKGVIYFIRSFLFSFLPFFYQIKIFLLVYTRYLTIPGIPVY